MRMVPGTAAAVSASYDKTLAAWDVGGARPRLLGTLGSQAAPVMEVSDSIISPMSRTSETLLCIACTVVL